MQVNCTVVDDVPETWFKGTRDEKAVRILTCLDVGPGARLKNTFDYRLTEEDAKKFPLGSLGGKSVIVQCRTIKPASGGRIVMGGELQVGANGK